MNIAGAFTTVASVQAAREAAQTAVKVEIERQRIWQRDHLLKNYDDQQQRALALGGEIAQLRSNLEAGEPPEIVWLTADAAPATLEDLLAESALEDCRKEQGSIRNTRSFEDAERERAQGQRQVVAAEGRKDDTSKDPWHLLPTDAMRAIVKVLAFGADKYQPRNWEQGMAWSRCYGALLRHITDWWETRKPDPETGLSHLWHAGCCIMFLIAYEIRGIGQDDRPENGK